MRARHLAVWIVAYVAAVALTVAAVCWPRIDRAEADRQAALARATDADGRAVNLSSELAIARDQLAKQPSERVVERIVDQRVGCLPAFERAARTYASAGIE